MKLYVLSSEMPKEREDLIPLTELILHFFKESIPYDNNSFGESNRFLQNVLKMAKEPELRLNRNWNRGSPLGEIS